MAAVLGNAIAKCNCNGDDSYWGKVQYLSIEDLCSKLNKYNNQSLNTFYKHAFPESAFLKREEFSHEKEFRFLKRFSIDTGESFDYEMIAFPFVAGSAITEICFDPRTDDCSFEKRRQELICMGCEPGIIKKSSLYKFEPLTLNIG